MSILDRASVRAALADGVTVVTPNRRLARALKLDFDEAQRGRGLQVWPSADVLPWDAWLWRCAREGDPLETPLLSDLQESVLWRQVVAESRLGPLLLQSDAAAASARDAWQRLHAFGLLPRLRELGATEDQQTFRAWLSAFEARLRGFNTATFAQFPTQLLRALEAGRWQPPARLVLAGFDTLTPQQKALLAALQAAGTEVVMPVQAQARPVEPRRVMFRDAAEQWRGVAAWAADALRRDPAVRLGIVVPDLGAQRAAIVAALEERLCPSLRWAPDLDAPRPFNVSLGVPLSQTPLVAQGLDLLGALAAPLPLADIGRLLRSPFVGDASQEWAARARLDRVLRELGVAQMDLVRLRRLAGRSDAEGRPHPDAAPRLAMRLTRVLARRDQWSRKARASQWVERLFEALGDLGFPGDLALGSVEYQTHQRFRELLASLAMLDDVLGNVSLQDMLAEVRRAAASTVFQAESGDVPIQVLGVLESAHLQFDALWIAQLTDDTWPLPADPNPLLPLAWQREAQMPGATPEVSLAFARRLQALWCASAPEVTLSHPLLEGDRELAPSPLIAPVPATRFQDLAIALAPPLPQQIRRDTPLLAEPDVHGPPLPPAADNGPRLALGGTRLFADQSACAFRAFAGFRLGARELTEPSAGLSRADRGRLLHAALAAVWRVLRNQQALMTSTDDALAQIVSGAAAAALAEWSRTRPEALSEAAARLEQERLQRHVLAWLAVERQRPPFEVIAIEQPAIVHLGGVQLEVTPDRVDRLEDGTVLIIDYKSRAVTTAAWLGERPDEPQLPLYAVTSHEAVAGVAFAQVVPGRMEFRALVAPDVTLPNAKTIADTDTPMASAGWSGLLGDWQQELERLAAGFIDGDAAVAPKRASSCQFCPMPVLCRLEARRPDVLRLEAGADGAERDHG